MEVVILMGAVPFVLIAGLVIWDKARKRRNERRRLAAIAWLRAQLTLARMGRADRRKAE